MWEIHPKVVQKMCEAHPKVVQKMWFYIYFLLTFNKKRKLSIKITFSSGETDFNQAPP